jgi:hypothetical protein
MSMFRINTLLRNLFLDKGLTSAEICAISDAINDDKVSTSGQICAISDAINDDEVSTSGRICAISDAINDDIMSDLEWEMLGLSGLVLVIFIYQYLMGYVERGQWNTYSNGAWEFRATYVCIELRLGSYPFQKFRVTPRKYSGVTKRTYDTKNGVIYKYEPWVRFKKDKFYFQGQTTAEKAARICDVAKFCLKIKGRKGYNFGEEQYTYLSSVQEFLPQQSDSDIKRLVLEYAKPFLNEVQVSEEVPIVDQPLCVEPARFANGEDNTIQGLSAYVDMVEGFLLDDTNEHTADMIQESQSVSPNPDIAGKYATTLL